MLDSTEKPGQSLPINAHEVLGPVDDPYESSQTASGHKRDLSILTATYLFTCDKPHVLQVFPHIFKRTSLRIPLTTSLVSETCVSYITWAWIDQCKLSDLQFFDIFYI